MTPPIPNHLVVAAMNHALEEAKHAGDTGDVPVGAVLLDSGGVEVGKDHNRREELNDPTAHAEMLVLSTRARELGTWRLNDHTLVVTLEPCAMCAGAIVLSRIAKLVYGTPDLKTGAVRSLYNIPQDARLNHRVEVEAGVMEQECADVLAGFFVMRRQE